MVLLLCRMSNTTMMLLVIFVYLVHVPLGNTCIQEERSLLLEMTNSFNSPYAWERTNCCMWQWVECNPSSRVEKLHFDDGYFDGYPWSINVSFLVQFKELKELLLYNYDGNGRIINLQGLCELKNLTSLQLGLVGEQVMVLHCIGKLSMLEELGLTGFDFRKNSLGFLTDICDLPLLKELDMWDYNIDSSTFSKCMGKLSSLEELSLFPTKRSKLNIEEGIWELSRLKDLTLDNFMIDASTFSKGICDLRSLQTLSIWFSNFSGDVTLKCLEGLPSLTELQLVENELRSPMSILQGLCNLSGMRTLYLDFNNLNIDGHDVFPLCLRNLSMLEVLDLSGNNFSRLSRKSLSGLCNLSGMRTLHLRYTNLNLDVDDVFPLCLGNLSMLENIDLSGNDFSKLSGKSLTGICKLSALNYLYLYSNNLSSIDDVGFPMCLGNLTQLQYLNLGSYNLSRLFVNSVATGLKQLQYMDVSSNSLTNDENSPLNIHNLTSLKEVYLENNKLKSSNTLKGICKLSALKNLDLSSNNLSSIDEVGFPMCLGNLTQLQYLYLGSNNLSRLFVNSVTGLKQLQYMRVSSNSLTNDENSPLNIHNLTSLKDVYLENNKLKSSNTLKEFCKMRSLRNLDVHGNSIEGNIPHCFGGMNQILGLDLSQNQLTGSIPLSISNLTKLIYLNVSKNFFYSSFSFSTIANISSFRTFDISHNIKLEVETEHPRWLPTFQLEILILSECIINKHSHGLVPSFILTQHELLTIEANHCSLKGKIPSWLFYNNSSYETLNLKCNYLEGPFPLWNQEGNTSIVQKLDISANNVHGELPPNMDAIFQSLVFFNMSSNALSGAIPSSIRNIIMLTTLDLSDNFFSGNLPHNFLGKNTSLMYVKFSYNMLQGSIHLGGSNVSKLMILLLDSNLFRGTLSFYSNCTSLFMVDLRRNFLSRFAPSWSLPLVKLSFLLLSTNSFHGPLPLELCQLQQIHFLDLSMNKFSGSLPYCLSSTASWRMKPQLMDIEKFHEIEYQQQQQQMVEPLYPDKSYLIVSVLTTRVVADLIAKGMVLGYEGLPLLSMTGIDLSLNQLSGNIPSKMGYLKEIRMLNLSNNAFSGHIPDTFQNLKNVESLDLSNNKLSGVIPPQLVQLTSLVVFNVSFNNLSGAIPHGNQFDTFNETVYIGNLNLCGPPLHKSCSISNHHKKEEEELRILDNHLFFYSIVAIGYAIGFWSYVCLFFNKRWQEVLSKIANSFWGFFYMNSHRLLQCIKNHGN